MLSRYTQHQSPVLSLQSLVTSDLRQATTTTQGVVSC